MRALHLVLGTDQGLDRSCRHRVFASGGRRDEPGVPDADIPCAGDRRCRAVGVGGNRVAVPRRLHLGERRALAGGGRAAVIGDGVGENLAGERGSDGRQPARHPVHAVPESRGCRVEYRERRCFLKVRPDRKREEFERCKGGAVENVLDGIAGDDAVDDQCFVGFGERYDRPVLRIRTAAECVVDKLSDCRRQFDGVRGQGVDPREAHAVKLIESGDGRLHIGERVGVDGPDDQPVIVGVPNRFERVNRVYAACDGGSDLRIARTPCNLR